MQKDRVLTSKRSQIPTQDLMQRHKIDEKINVDETNT